MKVLKSLAIASMLFATVPSGAIAADSPGTVPSAAPSTAGAGDEAGTNDAIARRMGIPQPPSAAQKDLANQLIDAMNAKDPAKLKALIAPKTLQCFDASRQAYLDQWLQRQFRFPVDKDYQVTVAEIVHNPAAKSTRATFPVLPTHVLTISGVGSHRTSRRLIAEQDGKWVVVVGCPTDATLEKFAKSEQIRTRASDRADKVMPEVKEPLTSEVRALVAKGDRLGAAKLVAEKLNTDLLAARVVVDRIGGADSH